MQLKYGSYTFAVDSCAITMQIQTLTNERGLPYAQTYSANVNGYLDADSTTLISAASEALADALAVPYRDLILYTDAGVATHVALLNSGSMGGVVCSGPNFDNGKGAELSTYRTFSFTAKAEYPLTPGAFVLQSFTERISTSGTGGPRFVIREALTGLPQKQIVKQRTKCSANQSGQAVGYLSYPTPPPPLWPNDEKLDQRSLTVTAPKYRGRTFQDYAISWAYSFESAVPLIGLPNRA